MVRPRVRIRFCKQGDLRLIGHRDLMRCLERLFRRAGLTLGMSEGFHPKPRMTLPLALAVGIEGDDEVMELELSETLPSRGAAAAAVAAGPAGAGVPVGGSAAAGRPQGPACAAPRTRCPCRVAPRRPGGAHRPPVGRRAPGLSTPGGQRADRPPRRSRWRWRSSRRRAGRCGCALDPKAGAGPRDVLAALDLADLEREGVCLHAHRRGDRSHDARSRRSPRASRLPNACLPVLPNKKATL